MLDLVSILKNLQNLRIAYNMKIIKLKKTSQVDQQTQDNTENEKNYTVRSMLKDLSKWENFFKMIK